MEVPYSSLVGFALMAILTPIPTRIGQSIVGTQREKMAKVRIHFDTKGAPLIYFYRQTRESSR